MVITTGQEIENLTLKITQEIHVKAPLEITFASLLEQLEDNDTPDGNKLPMKLEAWPGGRWYRDLGNNNGHFWGVVQAIKRPTLLEICGPLMMSHPVISNLQYRLSAEPGGTLIKFHHLGFGLVTDEHRQGLVKGWTHIHERIRVRAEGKRVH